MKPYTELFDVFAEPLIDIYRRMEDDLIRSVSGYVSSGASLSTNGSAAWLMEKMSQLGGVNQDNLRTIAALTGKAEAEVTRAINAAGYAALEPSEAIYKEAARRGLTIADALPLRASASVQQIIAAAIENAKSIMNLVNTTALQSANAAAMRIINQVYLETSSGLLSYNAAMWKGVDGLARVGIKGMTYVSAAGRMTSTTPDVAIRRMIHTSMGQTAGRLQVARAGEWGASLVEVSSHMGARPSHAEWQGRVYMLEGSSAEYPNFYEATGYGTPGGLCGYNCRHTFYPFFEGLSSRRFAPYDLKQNARVYEESQQQRAIEREIRGWKRRADAAKGAGDEAGAARAAAKVREKQGKMREFVNDTGRTRRYGREQIKGNT